MREPLQDFRFDKSEYERPNQKWVCGWASDGRACRIGPDGKGKCRATCECTPLLKGDRWYCTRPKSAGGKCTAGPLSGGGCSRPIQTCQPVRSIRAKRGMTVMMVSAFTIGLILFFLGGSDTSTLKNAFLSPGDLSAPHGAIENCSACHTSKANSAIDSALATTVNPLQGLGETHLCLNCHQTGKKDALKAHGLSQELLAEITGRIQQSHTAGDTPLMLTLASLGPEVPHNDLAELACATCHREHHGRQHKLTEMDNSHCQACHTAQFASFANGHPEFSDFPSYQGVSYKYDHSTHQNEHFPKEGIEFDCLSCHYADQPNRENMLVGKFDKICASCHHHTEQVTRDGIPVFHLPGIDFETLIDNDISIGEWPLDAGIDLDTEISPLMQLLLSVEEDVSEDLVLLSDSDIPLYDLIDAEEEEMEAAARIAWAIKGLFYDMLQNGRKELLSRLQTALGADVRQSELIALVDQRSTEEIQPESPEWLAALEAAREQWFPSLLNEIPRYRAGRSIEFYEHEDYEEPDEIEWGNWYMEFDEFAILYRASGHTDHFYRRLAEASTRLKENSDLAQTILTALKADDAPGQCMKCHNNEANDESANQITWAEKRPNEPISELTKFVHAPHLVLDCQRCHIYQAENGFQHIEKNICANCHTQNRATESCLNCHSYHTEAFALMHSHQE